MSDYDIIFTIILVIIILHLIGCLVGFGVAMYYALSYVWFTKKGQIMGLIICGYQGIGKSSASNTKYGIIDFESSLFKDDTNRRNDNWYITYTKQAIALSEQGYIPLLSSHKVVRTALHDYAKRGLNRVTTIAPSPNLYDKWIDRLEKRYNENPTNKNYIAYVNAKDHMQEDVVDMASEPYFSHIYLNDTEHYDLISIIKGLTLMM